MKNLSEKVNKAIELLREAKEVLDQEDIEIFFNKRQHGGVIVVKAGENLGRKTREFTLPETSFLLVTFLLYYQREYADIVPYSKIQQALQKLKDKEEVSLGTLRTEVSRINDLFVKAEIPISIKAKRQQGYFISINVGKAVIDEDHEDELDEIAWQINIGDSMIKVKRDGSALRIITEEQEFNELIFHLLQDPKIKKIFCTKDSISLFSMPKKHVYSPAEEIQQDNPAVQRIRQERHEQLRKRLAQGIEYYELVSTKSFEKYLRNRDSQAATEQLDEIHHLLSTYPNYYFFPISIELPFGLLVFDTQFAFFTTTYSVNASALFLAGKSNVKFVHTIFADIYNASGMSKWKRTLTGERGYYLDEIEQWLAKMRRNLLV